MGLELEPVNGVIQKKIFQYKVEDTIFRVGVQKFD